jgi:beta-glucosidase
LIFLYKNLNIGVGFELKNVTCFPSCMNLVQSFNRKLINDYGKYLAIEFMGKGGNVLLGPMINIARVYHSGRNFETFGEDPVTIIKKRQLFIFFFL